MCVFPEAWKQAQVSPEFKESLKIDPNNYRLISALLDITNELHWNTEKNLVNGIIFPNLKTAFDTVDHNIVLGLCGVISQSIDSFHSLCYAMLCYSLRDFWLHYHNIM